MHKSKPKGHPLSDRELIVKIKNFSDDDALIELMNRYLPLIKSMASKYYARGMDLDDWKQEAALVLIKIVHRYRFDRQINFGAYYRSCLKNRFYDFIRKQSAKKRIPNNCIISYSANQDYYDDVLLDFKAVRPDRRILVNDLLRKLFNRCSAFEQKVMKGRMNHRSESFIARKNHCSVSKVKNATERYQRKFNKMRANGLD